MLDQLLTQAHEQLEAGNEALAQQLFIRVWTDTAATVMQRRTALEGISNAIAAAGNSQRAEDVRQSGRRLLLQLANLAETGKLPVSSFVIMPPWLQQAIQTMPPTGMDTDTIID